MGASDGMRPKALTAKTSPASPTSEPPNVQTGLARARMKMSLTLSMIPLLPGHRHRPLAPTERSETDGKRRHGGIGRAADRARAEARWASAHPHARSRPQPPVPGGSRGSMADETQTGSARMTAERWRRVDALLSAALARERDQRAAFLAQECKEDDELRKTSRGIARRPRDE